MAKCLAVLHEARGLNPWHTCSNLGFAPGRPQSMDFAP